MGNLTYLFLFHVGWLYHTAWWICGIVSGSLSCGIETHFASHKRKRIFSYGNNSIVCSDSYWNMYVWVTGSTYTKVLFVAGSTYIHTYILCKQRNTLSCSCVYKIYKQKNMLSLICAYIHTYIHTYIYTYLPTWGLAAGINPAKSLWGIALSSDVCESSPIAASRVAGDPNPTDYFVPFILYSLVRRTLKGQKWPCYQTMVT